MRLQPIPEDFLFNKVPPGVARLDKRGILQALLGGYQDRIEDLRSYVLRYGDLLDPTYAFPETSNNVVFATYTNRQGRTIVRSITTDSSTPVQSSYQTTTAWQAALNNWASTCTGIPLDRLSSAALGTDFLRLVTPDILQYLADTFGATIYNTTNALTTQQQQRIVAGYFARLKIKGTPQSFEILGQLMNFSEVVMSPLWGRLSPRLPNDIGNPVNDQDFAVEPEIIPTQAVGAYDPLNFTDGGVLYGWPSDGSVASLSANPSDNNFYPSAINGYNPFFTISVTPGTVVAPQANTQYVLAGGTNHLDASVVLYPGPVQLNTAEELGSVVQSAPHQVSGIGAIYYNGSYYAGQSVFTGVSGGTIGSIVGSVSVFQFPNGTANLVTTNSFVGVNGQTYAVVTPTPSGVMPTVTDANNNVISFQVVLDSANNSVTIVPNIAAGQVYYVTSNSASASDYVTYNGTDIGGINPVTGLPYMGLSLNGIVDGTQYSVVGTGLVFYNGVCYASENNFVGVGGTFSPVASVGENVVPTDAASLSVVRNPGTAMMVATAIAEGAGLNGVTIDTTGSSGSFMILPFGLSAIKYRTSYYNFVLATDIDDFISAFGVISVKTNPDLSPLTGGNPSLCGPTAVSPYCPWSGDGTRVEASPISGNPLTQTQLDTSILITAGQQALQYFEEVRPATRFPRKVSYGFSVSDSAQYAPFQSQSVLVSYTSGLTSGLVNALSASPPPPLVSYTASLALICADGTLGVATGELDPNDPTVINFEASVVDQGNVTRGFTGSFRFPTGGPQDATVSPTQLLVNQFRYSMVGAVAPGQQIVANWSPTTTEVVRDEPTEAGVGYQPTPEDGINPLDGWYCMEDDASVLSGLVAGGERVDLNTYAPDATDASLTPESRVLTVLDQSGAEYDILGYDAMTLASPLPIRYKLSLRISNSDGTYTQGQAALGVGSGTFYTVGSANGVLVADVQNFWSPSHALGLVAWLMFNRHPEDAVTIADYSSIGSTQSVSGISNTDSLWDSNRGWYTNLRSGSLVTSSSQRNISGNISVSLWLNPGSGLNACSGTILEIGSAQVPSGFIQPGVVYDVSGPGSGPWSLTYNGISYASGFIGVDGVQNYMPVNGSYAVQASSIVNPTIPVVSAVLSGATLTWMVKSSFGSLQPVASVALDSGVFNFVSVSISKILGEWVFTANGTQYSGISYSGFASEDQFLQICGTTGQIGIHDVRIWNVAKSAADFSVIQSPSPRPAAVVQVPPYFVTQVQNERWNLQVLPSGFVCPSISGAAPAWMVMPTQTTAVQFPANLLATLSGGSASLTLIAPVIPGTLTIYAGGSSATDNELGLVPAVGGVTGTINYATGALSVTGSNIAIKVQYSYSTAVTSEVPARAIRYLGSGRYYGTNLKHAVGVGPGVGMPEGWSLGSDLCDVSACGSFVASQDNLSEIDGWTSAGGSVFQLDINSAGTGLSAVIPSVPRNPLEIAACSRLFTPTQLSNLLTETFCTPPAKVYGDSNYSITVQNGQVTAVSPGGTTFSDNLPAFSASSVFTPALTTGYLYGSQQLVCSASGNSLYAIWEDPDNQFVGKALGYATKTENGTLTFTFSGSPLPAGGYAMVVSASNVGQADPGFNGFNVEVSINDSVVVVGTLNDGSPTTLEFVIPTMIQSPWSVAFNWTNFASFPNQGFNRQISVASVSVYQRTAVLYSITPSTPSLLTVVPTGSPTASTPGGVIAGVVVGTLAAPDPVPEYTHESTICPEAGYPLAVILTGTTVERNEHISSSSASTPPNALVPAAPSITSLS